MFSTNSTQGTQNTCPILNYVTGFSKNINNFGFIDKLFSLRPQNKLRLANIRQCNPEGNRGSIDQAVVETMIKL